MIASPPRPILVAVSPADRVVLMPHGLAWPPALTVEEAKQLRDDLDAAICGIETRHA